MLTDLTHSLSNPNTHTHTPSSLSLLWYADLLLFSLMKRFGSYPFHYPQPVPHKHPPGSGLFVMGPWWAFVCQISDVLLASELPLTGTFLHLTPIENTLLTTEITVTLWISGLYHTRLSPESFKINSEYFIFGITFFVQVCVAWNSTYFNAKYPNISKPYCCSVVSEFSSDFLSVSQSLTYTQFHSTLSLYCIRCVLKAQVSSACHVGVS